MTSTTFDLPGCQIDKQLDLCRGVLVRSVGFAKGFTGGFKALKAEEVPQNTDVVNEAREEAVSRLMEHARHRAHKRLRAAQTARNRSGGHQVPKRGEIAVAGCLGQSQPHLGGEDG